MKFLPAMTKSSRILALVLATISGIMTWQLFEHGYRSATSYTCIRCRAIKHKDRFLWHRTESIEQTGCSEWHARHRPAHEHEWGWSGGTRTDYPLAVAWASGDQHRIWGLPPDGRKRFMEAATPAQAARFEAAVASPDAKVQQQAISEAWDAVIDAIE